MATATKTSVTKEERFKKIAARRTQFILDARRKLGNCSNKGSYTYSNDDVSKIFNTIDSELKRIRALFSEKTKSNKFSL